jgi:hypothetical protein
MNTTNNEMPDDEFDKLWEEILAGKGLKASIPPSDFLSRDLTEASLMIGFWLDQRVIRRIGE